jgi:hypothetical protein
LTGGNVESVPDRKGKRKLVEDITSEEAKKVKLMELASEPPPLTSGPLTSGTPPRTSRTPRTSGPLSAPSSSRASGQVDNSKKKSLLGLLLTGGKVDAGKGFGLFD